MVHLTVRSPAGEPMTVSGYKVVRDDPGNDIWDDTSTLYTRVFRGHVDLSAEADGDVLAAGIIRVLLLDFLHQLTTFEVEGANALERAAVMAQFGRFFSGRLWDVYARRILSSAPF